MPRPSKSVIKKPVRSENLNHRGHKKTFYKYKKLLQKEGINTAESKPLRSHARSGSKEENAAPTNALLQIYRKVRRKDQTKQESLKKRQEWDKTRREKIKAKKERHIKLNKFTKKGQPVMKSKVEVMLDKIMQDQDTYSG